MFFNPVRCKWLYAFQITFISCIVPTTTTTETTIKKHKNIHVWGAIYFKYVWWTAVVVIICSSIANSYLQLGSLVADNCTLSEQFLPDSSVSYDSYFFLF